MIRALSLIALAVALAGCASTGGEYQQAAVRTASRIVPVFDRQEIEDRYTALEAAGAPAMLAAEERSNRRMVLRQLDRAADGTATWIAEGGTGFTFRGGILVATRGVGGDLMATDIAQVAPLIREARAGRGERFHARLSGTNDIVIDSYICDTSPARAADGTLVLREDCVNPNDGFVNSYTLGPGGHVVHSRQRVGKSAGYYVFSGARNE